MSVVREPPSTVRKIDPAPTANRSHALRSERPAALCRTCGGGRGEFLRTARGRSCACDERHRSIDSRSSSLRT
ncbi:unnamed protein product [Mycena citricolor]|uniref:Uncharacterized protein n=1 Tax=Mycena citricolor TaxID=2018698 RepID=A0AAD2H826_9AGAR|nr:unnamed protein product [Mycena citricolor]